MVIREGGIFTNTKLSTTRVNSDYKKSIKELFND